jgi:restriction system protein
LELLLVETALLVLCGGQWPVVDIVFPVMVQASHDPGLTAQLLNAYGLMLYDGQEYRSPSGAGKAASGWKSTNGWTFWRYQRPDTGEWQAIQTIRAK